MGVSVSNGTQLLKVAESTKLAEKIKLVADRTKISFVSPYPSLSCRTCWALASNWM